MISPPRDIFSDALCVPAPKPPRAPVVDAMASMAEDDLAKAMTAATAPVKRSAAPNEFRKPILALLHANGGMSASDIGYELGLDPQSASNRMRGIIDHGLVSKRKSYCGPCGNFIYIYTISPIGMAELFPDSPQAQAAAEAKVLERKRNSLLLKTLRMIAENPMIKSANIQRRTKLHESTVNNHIRALKKSGWIASGDENRIRDTPWIVSPAGSDAIAHLQRAGGQPQREVGILQGDGAGRRVGPLAGKFKGVK